MVALPLSSRADDFDLLRAKWFNMLTFGTNATKSDTNYYAWISQVESNAQSFSSSMATGPSRTFLWSKYSQLGSDSGDITGTYSRLRAMALGYAVQGSSNYTNVVLRSNILSGLDWMYTNYYNASVTNEYDNWFDWEIATPLYLNDTAILLYPNLSALQRSNYTNAIDYFVPDASQIQVHTTSGPSPATGANKVWKASVLAVRALIVTNSSKLLAATQALSGVFPYVTNGDGFYADGSFVFHSNAQGVGGFAYNGGYGAQLLATIGPLMQLLNNSPWQITDPARTNVFRWVYDSFEPFIYRGGLMEMVSGRYYTRDGDGHLDADEVLQGIISLAPVAPPADAAAYKSIMKYWIQSDTYRNFVQNQPPPFNVWALDVLNDPAVVPANELVRSFQFPRMDRALHLRPGWGFALSMSSNRRENYESIGAENLRGWYTGDGMTYLYNADLAQYADNYWSTVNPYRLPGTTVDTQFRADGSGDGYRSTNTWVGGASLQNLFGVSGMQFSATNTTLTATKSWFMFDDEVVLIPCSLGA
jgi:hyaluronate lyase